MSTVANQTGLPNAVRRMLDAVRLRVRAYVWTEGLALLLIVLGAAFWAGLALDWWFEPSPAVRRVGLVVVLVAALYVIYRYLLSRVLVPISDTSAAMLLERRYAELGDHVLTSVYLANSPEQAADYDSSLVAHTRAAAERAISGVLPGGVFDRRPLVRALVGAAAVCASIVLFATLANNAFAFWIGRIALSPEPWPRRVHLEVVGFPSDQNGNRLQKLAAEDDFELLVRAQTSGYEVPSEVEIRYRLADGRRGRDTLVRVGDAVPGRDEFQIFRYEFKRVAADMTFDVVGGDDRVRDLQIAVVPRPELSSIELECRYPPYLSDYFGPAPRRLAVTGGMRIPEGTRLVLHATATKPLTAVHVHTLQSGRDEKTTFTDQPQGAFRWEFGPLTEDDVLLISVTDTDAVSSREPYRVSIAAVPDELPDVAVSLSGIGTAITPDAQIPLSGQVKDEYGLQEIWYEFQVNAEPFSRRSIGEQPGGAQAVNAIVPFDLRAIEPATGQRLLILSPGQKFSLALKATDRYDLSDVSRAGSSPVFVLDVVTLSQLLALLERRELELRQRFEAIYEKVTDTRNLLARVDFATPNEEAAAADAADQRKNADDPQNAISSAAERALARRRLRVAGSLQNVTQAADEVLGVAEAFEDVHDQLTNNRIDNPDLKRRLMEQIALPLRQIGEVRMPELAAQVKWVDERIEDAEAGPAGLTKAVALADEILVDMKQVLDRMLELETYNEVVSLLRAIIGDQEEINRQTKEQQRIRLRGMFEDK